MPPAHQQICDDILLVLNQMKGAVTELAEAEGLTKMQLFALYSIQQHETLAMGKVAGILHCDASNVTGIIDRLVLQGYVIRQEAPHDRRAKTLRLTPQGAEITQRATALLPTKLGCHKLNSQEARAFHEIVQKLCAS